MEEADFFVRTLDEEGSIASSDESEPELSDPLKPGTYRKPFFETERPAGWDLSAAKEDAAKSLPFQTSLDHKIRTTLKELKQSPPSASASRKKPEERDDSTDPEEPDNVEKSDDADKGESVEDPENTSAQPLKKGKKRLRKEKATAKTFEELNLSRSLLKAVSSLEWTVPTPVQARAIPYVLAGRDVCGSAVTGSGKTAAFILPILERLVQSGIDNVTRVAILLPTRELAAQCHAVIMSLAKYTSIRAALAVGGLSNKSQESALRTRPHILVATPGRLIDHIRNAQSFSLDDIEILVMDEADRLLEMGFKDEIEEIVRHTPRSRQTLLFSATMNDNLTALIKLSLQNPAKLMVDPMFDVASTLSQEFVKLKSQSEANKDAVLFALVHRTYKTRTIIFFRQKVTAHRFRILFGLSKLKCAELHGNLTQAQRLEALDSFRKGDVDFLLCTDLAARGLDIAGVETVINYDMPTEAKEYVHRVGRTARAGADGRCCSIVCSDRTEERKILSIVAKRAKSKLRARNVPPSVLGKWRAWIDSLESATKKVLKEERHEKQLRMAEMELEKASNIMKHSDEIYGRPARTWFQSEADRREAKVKSRARLGLAPSKAEIAKSDSKKRKAEVIEEKRKQDEKTEIAHGYGRQRAAARKAKKRKTGKRK